MNYNLWANYIGVMMRLFNRFRNYKFNFLKKNDIISKDPIIFVCGVSRSGTTLLSAIFDAHSQICMGYEMLFPSISGVKYIINNLKNIELQVSDLKAGGALLRKNGMTDLGKWISRCHRIGLGFDDMFKILENFIVNHGDSLRDLKKRLILIKSVLDCARISRNSTIVGFKIVDTQFELYAKYFPSSYFVYILRDPRDIFASLKERGFVITLNEFCRGWLRGINSFKSFQEKFKGRSLIIKYEDLTMNPRESVTKVFSELGIPLEDSVLNFHNADLKIFESSHPNAVNLQKGFYSSSIGRYKSDLSSAEAKNIALSCHDLMVYYDYLPSETGQLRCQYFSLPAGTVAKKTKWLSSKRKYQESEYVNLLSPYIGENYDFMTHLDYVRCRSLGDRNIVIIRHDVDHDHIMAQKIAKWEYDYGIKSTFCLLHTAWYYGKMDNGRIVHTNDLIECAQYISNLGHEINFHNNLIVAALNYKIRPECLLRDEIDFFKSIGIEIKGTSTHGDALCRQLNFRNWEFFSECCDDKFGGPREIQYEGIDGMVSIDVGKYSMFDFDLEYEAYDIGKDVYHTDSGGKLRVRYGTKGRRNFGRNSFEGKVVGVLTHPIWWNF